MYSGTTFRVKSGRIMGTHQKIDRVAHRHLQAFLPTGHNFPTTRQILHFEGKNGPDGIKKKSPEILVGVGIVGMVVGTVVACERTTKLHDILKDANGKPFVPGTALAGVLRNFCNDKERFENVQYCV